MLTLKLWIQAIVDVTALSQTEPQPVPKVPVSAGRQKVREQKKRELRAAANGRLLCFHSCYTDYLTVPHHVTLCMFGYHAF